VWNIFSLFLFNFPFVIPSVGLCWLDWRAQFCRAYFMSVSFAFALAMAPYLLSKIVVVIFIESQRAGTDTKIRRGKHTDTDTMANS